MRELTLENNNNYNAIFSMDNKKLNKEICDELDSKQLKAYLSLRSLQQCSVAETE
jgi:hypothetical protein